MARIRGGVALLAAGLTFAGCGADHLMLAEVPAVSDAGQVDMVPDSAPVIAADGKRVIYVQATLPAPPVVSRDLATRVETKLFNVPVGSSLSTLNYRTGTLLFSVPDSSGARHILEYSLSGDTIRNFSVASGFQDFQASISPDGNTLAFIRRNESTGVRRLCTRDVSSGSSAVTQFWSFVGTVPVAVRWLDNLRVLVSAHDASGTIENVIQTVTPGGSGSPVNGLGYFATADPGGDHVASLIGSAGALDLWLSRIDGGTPTRLTESVNAKSTINWSIDRRTIVYVMLHGQPPVRSLEVVSLPPLQ